MKFRNYCVVIMGNTEGSVAEISSFSETEPSTLDAKGILIATFSSVAEPSEISEYLKMCNRSFLVFDMDQSCSGFDMVNRAVYKGLFGFLDNQSPDELQERTDKLMKQIGTTETEYEDAPGYSGVTVDEMTQTVVKELTEVDIAELSAEEKNAMMNTLIDKAIKNELSEDDKSLLEKLTQ